MPRVILDQNIKPISEFRANAAAFIKQVQTMKRPLVLTTHGKSATVLDVAEYEALIEKSEVYTAEIKLEVRKGRGHKDTKKPIVKKSAAKKHQHEQKLQV